MSTALSNALRAGVRSSIGAVERVSPGAAARLAFPLFLHVGRSRPVARDERTTHDAARRSALDIGGRRVIAYEWGHGADVVLLVHGWRGRASQFAALVRELRAEGLTVVAFDAPANGDAPGRRTDGRDYLAAIHRLERRYGGFRAIVAHSFGALPVFAAIDEGVRADRLATVAGVADAAFLVEAFAPAAGLGPRGERALAERFEHRIAPAPLARFSGTRHPFGLPLLAVHDAGDRRVPLGESERLVAAQGDSARLLVTAGAGHNRILATDATLDAIVGFVTAPARVPDQEPRPSARYTDVAADAR